MPGREWQVVFAERCVAGREYLFCKALEAKQEQAQHAPGGLFPLVAGSTSARWELG
jgi:hypothetical protein